MNKILVVGSKNPMDQETRNIASFLGELLMERDCILLGGCDNELDTVVAEAAATYLKNHGREAKDRIWSWISSTAAPAHNIGNIIRSRLQHWSRACPEAVEIADAIVLIGGAQGTWKSVFWSQRAGVPIVPIARTGGTAYEFWVDTLDNYDEFLGGILDRVVFENLNTVVMSDKELASHAITVSEKLITKVAAKDVFVAMSMDEDDTIPVLKDALDVFRRVATQFDLTCRRIDEVFDGGRISVAIEELIRKSRFIFVDLTGERPNVYYELGYANAYGKRFILTAVQGTTLHFDIRDYPVIFYESGAELEKRLVPRVHTLLGRT